MYPPNHRYTARVYRAKTINKAAIVLLAVIFGLTVGYLATLPWSA